MDDPSLIADPNQQNPPMQVPGQVPMMASQGPPPPEKEHFHNTMADFDHRKDANRAEMIALNPSDPQYVQKVGALQAQHGALTTEKARFQMLHPWGGPQAPAPDMTGQMPASAPPDAGPGTMQMPQYGGPGKPVAQGSMVPAKQLPGDEFKYRQSMLGEKVAAAEGDPDKWAEAKGEVARNKMDNPWGSPGNHPGILGTIGHNIGNSMAAFSPQAELQAEERGSRAAETHEAEQGLKTAQTAATNALVPERGTVGALNTAKADAVGEPKTPQQVLAGIEQEDIAAGKDPTQDARYQQAMDTITGTQKQPAEKAPHVTYDAGIPVSVTAGDKTYDINDPKLPPELKPLVEAAQRAHGQHTQEDAAKQAAAFGQQEKMFNERQGALTNATKTMLEAAPRVSGFIQRIGPLIDKLEASGELGPGAGRWSEFWAGKVGTRAPEFTKLRTDVGLLSTLLMRMHVGARGGEYIMKHFSDMIDSGKQSPDNMRAALGEIAEYAKQLEQERQGAPGGNAAPPKPENNTPPPAAQKKWNAVKGVYE